MPAMNSNRLFSNLLGAASVCVCAIVYPRFCCQNKALACEIPPATQATEMRIRDVFTLVPDIIQHNSLKNIQTSHIVVAKRIAPVQPSQPAWMVCIRSCLFSFYGMGGWWDLKQCNLKIVWPPPPLISDFCRMPPPPHQTPHQSNFLEAPPPWINKYIWYLKSYCIKTSFCYISRNLLKETWKLESCF